MGMFRWLGVLGLTALAAIGLLAGGCGSGSDGEPASPGETLPAGTSASPAADAIEAVVVSSDLAVGQQRFAFVLLRNQKPIRETPVYVRFFRLDGDQATLAGQGLIPWEALGTESLGDHDDGSTGTHVETTVDGGYFANISFDRAGNWGAGFSLGEQYDPESEVRVRFEVKEKTQTVGVGEKAIAVDSPTLADYPLDRIDTSPEPDEEMHRLSIAEGVSSGRPTVIAFATPSFCQTRTCGPTMEVVRVAADEFAGKADFIHVEPYELDEKGRPVTRDGGFVTTSVVDAWNLPTEPWVFVVDSDGIVRARFEGLFSAGELRQALNQVLQQGS